MCRRSRSAWSNFVARGPRDAAGRSPRRPCCACVTALPGVRTRAARANTYGPNPPQLDVETMAAVHAS